MRRPRMPLRRTFQAMRRAILAAMLVLLWARSGAVKAELKFGLTAADLKFDAPSSCESLASLSLHGGAIVLARTVPAGAFTPPGANGRGGAGAQAFTTLPAFCRV